MSKNDIELPLDPTQSFTSTELQHLSKKSERTKRSQNVDANVEFKPLRSLNLQEQKSIRLNPYDGERRPLIEEPSPSFSREFESKKKRKRSNRVKYVHKKVVSVEDAVDKTLKAEERFMQKIEHFKSKRLEQECYCAVTKKLLIQERFEAIGIKMKRIGRLLNIVLCPPCCCLLPRVAFWPPPRAYFFFKPPDDYSKKKNKDEPIAERKKKYEKMEKACAEAIGQSYKIGMVHACAKDVDRAVGFVVKTRNNNYIACVHAKSRSQNPRFHILYSHPNGSDLSDHLVGVPCFQDMARFYHCDIYGYDYSGYGISSGVATESNQNSDIEALYLLQHMTQERKIPPNKIVLMGYSIGTCASVDLVVNIQESVAGVVLMAPPASILRTLIWKRSCIGLPCSEKSCCIDRFKTFDKICDVKVPVLVIHGEQDDTVPVEHGITVFNRSKSTIEPLWVSATHNNLENCREVWLRIRKFLREDLKHSSSSIITKSTGTGSVDREK